MHVSPIPLSAVAAGAYALLALAGLLLWKRARSFATALATIGFAIILLDQILLIASYLRTITALRGYSGDTLFLIYHRANSMYVLLAGMWCAAIGLVWHALQRSHR